MIAFKSIYNPYQAIWTLAPTVSLKWLNMVHRVPMAAALIKKKLDLRKQKSTRPIILIVLGVDRGPLVNCLIDAIKTVDSGFK